MFENQETPRDVGAEREDRIRDEDPLESGLDALACAGTRRRTCSSLFRVPRRPPGTISALVRQRRHNTNVLLVRIERYSAAPPLHGHVMRVRRRPSNQ